MIAVAAALVTVPTVLTVANSREPSKECLAEAIHREARGETIQGMRAIAQVVLNRLQDIRFPKTICGVVFQSGQFSWTKTWNTWGFGPKSEAVAEQALQTGKALPGFKATHFHSTSVDPEWNLQPITTIGNHKFYK